MTRRLALAAALAAAATLPAAVLAQSWPARPVHLVVPYAPGGPVDVSARLLAAALQGPLGQPVVVENKTGAGGNLGADTVAKIPYDPVRDFRHIALVVQVPNVLVVNNDVPARSVAEFTAWLKANPGKASFASGSTGSTGHLAGELFKKLTDTDMVHIPYKGSAPAITDLLAGRVHLMFDNLASALPNIRAGKVRALAVTTAARSSFVPELPTLPGFDMTTWWGVMAPARTPDAVVERLAAEIGKAIEAPEQKERLRAMGSDTPSVRTPAQFTAFVERELAVYSDLVRRSGAKAD
jgi:tripartite-type tricarboxylate transporter receptor subunit TctC